LAGAILNHVSFTVSDKVLFLLLVLFGATCLVVTTFVFLGSVSIQIIFFSKRLDSTLASIVTPQYSLCPESQSASIQAVALMSGVTS
jgi:hypothetical protein